MKNFNSVTLLKNIFTSRNTLSLAAKRSSLFTFSFYLFNSFLFLLSLNCNHPTEVENKSSIKQYQWSEEKLIQPLGKAVIPTAIWGSAPDDVWVVGWNTSWQGEIFHLDGSNWNNVTPKIPRNTIYNDVFGFGKNDVYVVGYTWWQQPTRFLLSSLILHYDGNTWSIVLEDSTNQGFLNKIHGNSKNNIWAVGGNGSVYNYNGANWTRMPFPDTLEGLSVYCLPDNQVFMTYEFDDHQLDGLLLLHFGEYTNNWINTRDTCRITIQKGEMVGYKFGYKAMWGTTNSLLYSAGPIVCKYNGSNWKLDARDEYPLNDIKGTSPQNIYIVGDHGTLYNFTGSKWEWISKYGSTIVDFKAVMPFENVIYILGFYQDDSWIIKGEVIK